MADPLLLGGLYRFFDDTRGEWIDVPVAVDLAATIGKLDAAMAQREARRKKARKEVCFSDIGPKYRRGESKGGLEPDDLTDDSRFVNRRARSTATTWAGEHFLFRILVGIGCPWPGPAVKGKPCPCCAGLTLSPIACCIYCNRTGVDLSLPKLTAAELRAKLRAPRQKGEPAIAGGTGPAAPVVAPKAAAVKATRPAKVAKKPKKRKPPRPPAVKAPKSGWRAELDAMKAQVKR